MKPAARAQRLRRSLALGTLLLLVAGVLGCDPVRPPRASDDLRRRARNADTRREAPSPIYLVLKLDERRLYVMQDEGPDGKARQIDSYPVAIGRKEWKTPTGRFHVNKMKKNPPFVTFDWDNPYRATGIIPPGPDNPLGERWIGFASAHGWDIGFHGTPRPELLGQAVSHGCVRMHNRDVVALYEIVRIGTPVIVQQ